MVHGLPTVDGGGDWVGVLLCTQLLDIRSVHGVYIVFRCNVAASQHDHEFRIFGTTI